MGQKVKPLGLRVGVTKNWSSCWYVNKRIYADKLHEDIKIRRYLKSRLAKAGVNEIFIERFDPEVAVVTVHAVKPGVIIGKKGEEIDIVKKQLKKIVNCEVSLGVVEVRRGDIEAPIVANNIASQLAKRVSFKKALKRAMQNAMKMGAKGIKVSCSGRLGGAEIARAEWYKEGRIPLHTIRADISYGTAEAMTTYGVLGVKVWIYRGELYDDFVSSKKGVNF